MKQILIVEDELIIALALEQMIQNMGHEVASKVISGKKAVEKAVELRPDVILMDIRLKGKMDGIEAMQKIHNEVEIPVIYITGNNDLGNIQRIEHSRCVDLLIKPITQQQLLKSVKKAS